MRKITHNMDKQEKSSHTRMVSATIKFITTAAWLVITVPEQAHATYCGKDKDCKEHDVCVSVPYYAGKSHMWQTVTTFTNHNGPNQTAGTSSGNMTICLSPSNGITIYPYYIDGYWKRHQTNITQCTGVTAATRGVRITSVDEETMTLSCSST